MPGAWPLVARDKNRDLSGRHPVAERQLRKLFGVERRLHTRTLDFKRALVPRKKGGTIMATMPIESGSFVERRLDEDAYPEWKRRFSPEERRRMIDDDLMAGLSVPIVLWTVVAIGVVLAIVSVWITG